MSTGETTEETGDEVAAEEADGTLPPEPAPEGEGVEDEGDMVALPKDDLTNAAGEEIPVTYGGCEDDEDCPEDEECMALAGESRRLQDDEGSQGYCK